MDVKARFERRVRKGPGCWPWLVAIGKRRGRHYSRGTPIPEQTYGRFYKDGEPGFAHRVAWELYRGPIPPGINVLHRCDRPHCVRPDHLFLGSQHENILDSIAKGRFWRIPASERKRKRKLTELEVLEIRRSYRQGGWSHRTLALRFGVTQPAICYVLNGKTWKHVTDGAPETLE